MAEDAPHILHLGWTSPSSLWFHIGTFTAPKGIQKGMTFQYNHGMTQAARLTGYRTLLEFPDVAATYRSDYIFPILSNRLMPERRPDRAQYLELIGASPGDHPFEIIAASGGRKLTDSFDLFTELPDSGQALFFPRFSRSSPSPYPATPLEPGTPLVHETTHHSVENQPPTVRLLTPSGEELGLLPQHLAAHIQTPGASVKVHRINHQTCQHPVPRSLRLHLLLNLHPA